MADRYRDRSFPADDGYARDGRSAPQPSSQEDPLAELARLIGQADPFANFGRDQRLAQQNDAREHESHQPDEEPAGYDEEPARRPSWLQNLTSSRKAKVEEQPYDRQEPHVPQEQYGHQDQYSHQDQYGHQDQRYGQEPQYDPRYADPLGPDPHHPVQPVAEPRFDLSPRFEPQTYNSPQAPQEPGWGQQPLPDSARYDHVLYGQPDHDPNHGTPFNVQQDEYGDGYGASPYGEEDEEQAPRARRGGTMTVVVVLLLAVVGTAGAFAYRTLVGSPRSGEPPIIKADAGPNKIVPPGQGTDAAGKQIYDRVGDKNAERVVSREEQPVDVNARTSPRVVFPPLTQNNNPPTLASASPSVRPTGPGTGNGTLTGGEEPKKIRTLSIRPGEPDAPSAAPAPVPPARGPQPTQRASAPTTTASTPNAPVSLAPQALQPQSAADTRQVASLSHSAGAAGSYVQVSSQKNEADAQASFKALQAKYSGILGSRSATVRRADLGSKGVFYRAMVGPFGTTEEATQFCVSLKSAGGQCVVQRN